MKIEQKLKGIAKEIGESIYFTMLNYLETADSPEQAVNDIMDSLNDGDFMCDVEEIVKEMVQVGWSKRAELCE